MNWNLTYYNKEQEGWLYENGAGEKIVGQSRLSYEQFSEVNTHVQQQFWPSSFQDPFQHHKPSISTRVTLVN